MSNDFYVATGAPTTNSQGSSSVMRSEFGAIEDAFDKLPALTGNGSKLVAVNSGGTALEAVTSFNLSDGVITRPEIKDYSETAVSHGSMGATETFDCEQGNVHYGTLDANCVFTFSNPSPTGKACALTLILTQDGTGSRTVTWPASVAWAGGVAPTLTTTAAKRDVFSFLTIDAGTSWLGFEGGFNYA